MQGSQRCVGGARAPCHVPPTHAAPILPRCPRPTSWLRSGKVTRTGGRGRMLALSLSVYLSIPGWSGVAPLCAQPRAGVRQVTQTSRQLGWHVRSGARGGARVVPAARQPSCPGNGPPEAGQEHLDTGCPCGCQPRHLYAAHGARQPAAVPAPRPGPPATHAGAHAAPAAQPLAVAQLNSLGGAAGAPGRAGAAPAARQEVRQVPPAAGLAAAAAAAAAEPAAAARPLQRRQRKRLERGQARGQADRGDAVVARIPAAAPGPRWLPAAYHQGTQAHESRRANLSFT